MLSTENEQVHFMGYKCDTTLDDFDQDITANKTDKKKKNIQKKKKFKKGLKIPKQIMPTTVIVTENMIKEPLFKNLFPPTIDETSEESEAEEKKIKILKIKTEEIGLERKIESGKELEAIVVISSRQAGQFIGKSGSVINGFRSKTGASVQLQDRIVSFTEGAENKRLIKLKGDEATMADVIELICITMNTDMHGKVSQHQRLTLLAPNEFLSSEIENLERVNITKYNRFTFINVKGDSADVADICVDLLVHGLGEKEINEKLIKTGVENKNKVFQKMQQKQNIISANNRMAGRGGMRNNNFQQRNNNNNNNNRNNNMHMQQQQQQQQQRQGNNRFSRANYNPQQNNFQMNNRNNFQQQQNFQPNVRLPMQNNAMNHHGQGMRQMQGGMQNRQQMSMMQQSRGNAPNITSFPIQHGSSSSSSSANPTSMNPLANLLQMQQHAKQERQQVAGSGNNPNLSADPLQQLLSQVGGIDPMLLLQLLGGGQKMGKRKKKKRKHSSSRHDDRSRSKKKRH